MINRKGIMLWTFTLLVIMTSAAQTTDKNSLDPHFVFLYGLLKDNYDGYSSYIVATTSAILLMIGWLMTSKDARTFISRNSKMKAPMLAAIVFFLLAEIYFSFGAKCNSDKIVALIKMDVSDCQLLTYYQTKIVPWSAVVIFPLAHSVLFAILVAMIWSVSAQDSGD